MCDSTDEIEIKINKAVEKMNGNTSDNAIILLLGKCLRCLKIYRMGTKNPDYKVLYNQYFRVYHYLFKYKPESRVYKLRLTIYSILNDSLDNRNVSFECRYERINMTANELATTEQRIFEMGFELNYYNFLIAKAHVNSAFYKERKILKADGANNYFIVGGIIKFRS